MPINILKQYSDLLEILHLPMVARVQSLRGIFDRDIANNIGFAFRGKSIYPIKTDGELDMDREFRHLTTVEIQEKDDDGVLQPKKRVFEADRSMRLHWVRHHIEERTPHNIIAFTVTERDQKKRENITKTYLYDKQQNYVIVLECQRNSTAYYLLTAYHLNRVEGKKKIEKLLKKKQPEVL